MNCGSLVRHLDYAEEKPWLDVLQDYTFWKDSPLFLEQYDSIHKSLAFFQLCCNGHFGQSAEYSAGSPAFDHAPAPKEFMGDARTRELCTHWSNRHMRRYGPGYVVKMGLYTFAPGGQAGYHVDGVVRLEGDTYDLSTQREWDAAVHIQSTHRTVMPLIVGENANFRIVGKNIRITPGLWFEFSNTLPHAFFNLGDQTSMLLVTTYKPFSNELSYPSLEPR